MGHLSSGKRGGGFICGTLPWLTLSCVGLCLSISTGCHHFDNRVSYGTWYSFPPGTRYPDGEYLAAVTIRRTISEPAEEINRKWVVVTIEEGRTGRLEFQATYEVSSRQLESAVLWERLDDLTIEVYEPDEGEPQDATTGRHPVARPVRTLRIVRHAGGKFVDASP
jgi:hypothetical protein